RSYEIVHSARLVRNQNCSSGRLKCTDINFNIQIAAIYANAKISRRGSALRQLRRHTGGKTAGVTTTDRRQDRRRYDDRPAARPTALPRHRRQDRRRYERLSQLPHSAMLKALIS